MAVIVYLCLILGSIFIGAVSPGPSFVLVAKDSMSASRKNGIAAALGMGAGGLVFSIISLLGLHAILINVPSLYVWLKILGGCYLIYLGVRIYLQSKETIELGHMERARAKSCVKSFFIGFITQISNPKTAIVYGGIFATFLPLDFPVSLYFILPPLVFFVEAIWYLFVALVLSSSKPRAAYFGSKIIFDRIASAVLSGLGGKLVYGAVSNQP